MSHKVNKMNEKTTIPCTDVTDEMKVEWLQYFVEHGTFHPLYRHVWIETPRNYRLFNDSMLSYLKLKNRRPKNGYTISVAGRKWLDKQQGEQDGTNE
jgi:hypothetical protein